ncbi:hypothetical protein EFK50_09640 [Nocardioides marmoriginsengisoli]|uniref:DUF2339 domain-containing protein n=1 Tax=Nocardioides marmoriginsengisoli TaxID=661483 RepID=A0A3N0CF48_9ACTN|nr:hypothetical protein EFK50_09640 [Nocardioides marmoriginsengisoli]
MLPASERPAARPARRRADTPRFPYGSDPLTDPYGIPAITTPHAPRHAAARPLADVGPPEVAPAPVPEAAPIEAQVEAPFEAQVEAPVVEPEATIAHAEPEPAVQESAQEPAPGPAHEPAPEPAPVLRTRVKPAPARLRRRGEGRVKPAVAPPVAAPLTDRAAAPAAPAVKAPRTTRKQDRAPAPPRVPATNPSASRVSSPAKPATTVVADPHAARPTDREWWVILLLAGAVGIALVRIAPDLPDVIRQVGAVLVSGALAWGLAVRTGGRPIWATGLASALAIGAVVSDWQPLTAGAAVGTGVLAATLAIMVTRPAANFGIAIREVLIATGVAWLGALGVVGYGPAESPDVDVEKFEYAVLALALVGAFALVYRLGAGLHGLGRRGYVVAGGAVLMLVFALAYSEAIAQWGSRDIVGVGDDIRDWTKSTLGAVPHPIVALLGYPALVWGVFMRARRRQGWWVCAFGVAATAPSTTRLLAANVDVSNVTLGALYSFLVGIAVGYLVIRVEQSFTGTHGRRARRDEEAEAHRPEPRRTRPLH